MSSWQSSTVMHPTADPHAQFGILHHQQHHPQQQDEFLYEQHMTQSFHSDSVANFLDGSSIYNGYHDLCRRYLPDEDPSSSSIAPIPLVTRPTLSPFPPSSFDFHPGPQPHTEWSEHVPLFSRPQVPYPSSDKSSLDLTPTMHHIAPSLYMNPSSSAPSSLSAKHSPSPYLGSSVTPPATTISADIRAANSIAPPSRPAPSKAEGILTSGTRPREKKHGCWMCEKSFDRPSTLRKHLLVHTGEKAFVCEICGRRFGVASNLNRHVKRCILKPVNTAHLKNATVSPPTVSPPSSTSGTLSIDPVPTVASDKTSTAAEFSGTSEQCNKRKSMGDPVSSSSSGPSSPSQSINTKSSVSKAPTKRRRRAPSPSQWIPTSLLPFNLFPTEFTKSTPVPLPPISAYKDEVTGEWIEERDSWDEVVSATPYHPCGWKGKLPGPGLGFGGKELSSHGLVGGSGFVMGRLVMQ